MAKEALFTETVTIPTRGLLTPSIPDGLVTQRCISVADKKYLAGTKAVDGDALVHGLIKRCVVVPEQFDPLVLTPADMMFLLFKLRILSYGENYTFRTKCPECGKRIDVRVKLSELVVHHLPDDYKDHLTVTLPNKGDTVYTKFLTIGDLEGIKKEVRRLKKKFPNMEGDPEVTLRIARMIERVELKEPNAAGDTILEHPVDILQYVESLTDLDSIAIQSTVENIKVGIDPQVEYVCPECDEYIDVDLSFSGEFFRPKYDGKSR